jgi:hypothetical protein
MAVGEIMWKLIIITTEGPVIKDGPQGTVLLDYLASMHSLLTVYSFIYDEKLNLVEVFIPSIKR